MPEKNIADTIQSMLEKNKGFMTVKKVAVLLGTAGRRSLGIELTDSGREIRNKIEKSSEGRFIFRNKGRHVYILIPCEPYELVLSLLSETKAFDGRTSGGLPFTKSEFAAMLNELADEGKVKIILSDTLLPRIFKVSTTVKNETPRDEPDLSGGNYTREIFREAFNSLDEGKIFVRIPDLRRKLNWPREVFDAFIKDLRNDGTIGVYMADESTMTDDEIHDCFTDENNFRMGTVIWNAR